MAAGRLSNGSRKAGNVVFAVAGALLRDGEVVECIVQGRLNDNNGAAVLTNARLLLVNEHPWKPDVAELPVDGSLVIQGWQDDRTAALVLQSADRMLTVDRIADRPIAQEMAQRLRGRTGTAAPVATPPPAPPPPPVAPPG
jgi:hypothetical protein